MDPNQALAELRATLGPIRAKAEKEFEVPDIEDAIRLYEVQWGRVKSERLRSLADQAGLDLLTPLGDVFHQGD
jgi:hypothetical protein